MEFVHELRSRPRPHGAAPEPLRPRPPPPRRVATPPPPRPPPASPRSCRARHDRATDSPPRPPRRHGGPGDREPRREARSASPSSLPAPTTRRGSRSSARPPPVPASGRGARTSPRGPPARRACRWATTARASAASTTSTRGRRRPARRSRTPAGVKPQPGDLIVWDEHIGVVESVGADGTINTIEGNSSDQVSARSYPPGRAPRDRLRPPRVALAGPMEDPETKELRIEQIQRERDEREHAERGRAADRGAPARAPRGQARLPAREARGACAFRGGGVDPSSR